MQIAALYWGLLMTAVNSQFSFWKFCVYWSSGCPTKLLKLVWRRECIAMLGRSPHSAPWAWELHRSQTPPLSCVIIGRPGPPSPSDPNHRDPTPTEIWIRIFYDVSREEEREMIVILSAIETEKGPHTLLPKTLPAKQPFISLINRRFFFLMSK